MEGATEIAFLLLLFFSDYVREHFSCYVIHHNNFLYSGEIFLSLLLLLSVSDEATTEHGRLALERKVEVDVCGILHFGDVWLVPREKYDYIFSSVLDFFSRVW